MVHCKGKTGQEKSLSPGIEKHGSHELGLVFPALNRNREQWLKSRVCFPLICGNCPDRLRGMGIEREPAA
jgi:hypothetical protein